MEEGLTDGLGAEYAQTFDNGIGHGFRGQHVLFLNPWRGQPNTNTKGQVSPYILSTRVHCPQR